MNRFNKIFHHIKSKKIDEKIEYLNKELKKTGVVFESGPTMSTGSLYQVYTFVPAVPEETSVVPDSTGFIAGTSTQDVNGGDESDSNTWSSGWNNVTDMKNPNDIGGETNRNIPFTPDLSGWNGTSTSANDPVIFGGQTRSEGQTQPTTASGIAVYGSIHGNSCIGSVGADNLFTQILVGDAVFGGYSYPSGSNIINYYGNYSSTELQAAQNLASSYEENKSKGSVTRKVWVPFATVTSQTYANYTGAKKTTTLVTDGYAGGTTVQWALRNVSFLTGQQSTYVSQEYVPTIPILTQHGLDDPSFYAGNPNKFMDFLRGALDVGEKAFDWLSNNALQSLTNKLIYGKGGPTGGFAADPKYTKEKVQQIANNISDPEKKADFEKKMADLTSTIEKTAQVQKQAETEAKNIAAKFGLDVALTIFGGAILKGAGAAASKIPGASSIVSKATATGGAIVDKVTNLLKLTGKVDDAAALATATKAVNTATKAEQASKAVNALEAIGGTLDDVDDIIAVAGSAKYQAAMTQAKLAGSTTSSSASNAAFNAIEKAIQSGSDDAMKAAVKNANSKVLGAASSSTSSSSSGSIVSKINLKPQFKGGGQSFDLGGDWADIGISQFKSILTNPQKFGIKPGSSQWKRISKYAKDYLVQSYEPQGKLITEGWESPKYTYVDKDQQKRWFKEKDVAPVYPKKAPPKMVKGWHPKFVVKLEKPIPVIKVSKKDLERSHAFKPDEVEELMQLVKNLNDYIKRNPDHLAYARVRYPKHDPRLAALNYKLDMQLAAADEYIETRFPENERLFDRLMRRTKESIKLTDPKTYENNNGKLITFNKLARVDGNYQPRKIKVKKKPKMSQGKLFLLPNRKKKDDILKDKMAVLDKEIQKTMPDA